MMTPCAIVLRQVCPFFGDQFFWAQVVVDAGVGVAPCSALALSADTLTLRFKELTAEPLVAKVTLFGTPLDLLSSSSSSLSLSLSLSRSQPIHSAGMTCIP